MFNTTLSNNAAIRPVIVNSVSTFIALPTKPVDANDPGATAETAGTAGNGA